MSKSVAIPLDIQVDGVSQLKETFQYAAEGVDIIEIVLAPADADIEVDLQPGLPADISVLGIKSTSYQEGGLTKISFKVGTDKGDVISLDAPLVLTGAGAIGLLGVAVDKLFFSNPGLVAKTVTIVVARDVTP